MSVEALMLAGTAVSAGSSIIGGVTTFQQQRAQAEAAARNAQFQRDLGRYNAAAATVQAANEEKRYRSESRRRLSVASTQLATSGAETSGTPMSLIGDAHAMAEENALLIRYGGETGAAQEIMSSRIAERDSTLQSRFFRQSATSSLLGGFGRAAGQGLIGAGQIIGMRA